MFRVQLMSCLVVLLLSPAAPAQEEKTVFDVTPGPVYMGLVKKVDPDGFITVKPDSDYEDILERINDFPSITEGNYLGWVQPELKIENLPTARIFHVKVTQVQQKLQLKLQVSKEVAAYAETGWMLALFRPTGVTTAQIKAVPAFATIEDGANPKDASELKQAAQLASSKNNLKQIGLALHNYHDVHREFPPAVVYGPDGKPWHSWRVLLLPFLEQQSLYDRYKFEEPWDGPNNKKLLSQMPEIYRDPIHDEKSTNTHYAAITGKTAGLGTIYSPTGEPLKNPGPKSDRHRIRDYWDGTSNSLMVGSVSPKAKIPWMKPVDIKYSDELKPLGSEGSFAAPYQSKDGTAGVFLRGDGSVTAITTEIDHKTFLNLLNYKDSNPIDDYPELRSSSRGGISKVTMEFVQKDGKSVCLLRMEREVRRRGPRAEPKKTDIPRDQPDNVEGSSSEGTASPPDLPTEKVDE